MSNNGPVKPIALRNAWKHFLSIANPSAADSSAYRWVAAPPETLNGKPETHFAILRYTQGQPPVPISKSESGIQVLLRFGTPARYIGTEQDGVLKVVSAPNSFCVWNMQVRKITTTKQLYSSSCFYCSSQLV
jgi:hypothetical protein